MRQNDRARLDEVRQMIFRAIDVVTKTPVFAENSKLNKLRAALYVAEAEACDALLEATKEEIVALWDNRTFFG